MTDIPITPAQAYPTTSTKRLATVQDNFAFGDFMRWAGSPFASYLIRSTERDACAMCAAQFVCAGQVMEILTTATGYVAVLATPESAA